MKKILLLLLAAPTAWAATYHVDQASTEVTQDGSEAYPFKTISQASAAMSSGDDCIIHAGTYRERVVVADNNVTFRRYKDDEVVVSGADLVTGWTLYSGEIYKAPLSWSGHEFTQVFYQGAHQQIARYPDNTTGNMLRVAEDSGYMACETFNETGATRQVTFPAMESVPTNYWQGGIYRGITGRIRSNTLGDILSSSGKDLVCDPLSNGWKDDNTNWVMGGDSKGYILHLNALSREGEWWHESGMLYFWQPGGGVPDDVSVAAQVREEAFSIVNRTGVVLDGINIRAATLTLDNSDFCRLENCSFEYVQPYIKTSGYSSGYGSVGGVYMNGDNNVVDSCYFSGSWGHLLYLEGGTSNEIRNSVFQDNGWYSIFSSCLHINGSANTLIEYCTFGSTGRFHVRMDTNAKSTIRYCDFFDCMNMGQDAGSIQSVGKNLNNSEFAYNSIHDSDTIPVYNTGGKQYVVAFYIEDTSNYTAHHNVVWNFNNDDIPGGLEDGSFSYLGPRVTSQSGIRYYNNTVWDCDYRIRIWNRDGLGAISTEHWNNIFDSSMADVFGTPSLESGFDFQNNVSIAPAAAAANFENAAAGNFTLLDGSAAMDAGRVISGITDGYAGSAPDAGAIEEGTFMWRTGASITNNLRQQPFFGITNSIPGTILAADYDEGGIGLAYHDLTFGNAGGVYRDDDVDLVSSPGGVAVGSTVGGEWLEYTVSVLPGTYQMRLNVSAADSNRTVRVQLDGADLATLPVPNTGSLGTYQTVASDVTVFGGPTGRLRVCFDTGGINLESIEFVPAGSIAIDSYQIRGSNIILSFNDGPANSSFILLSKTNLMDAGWITNQAGLSIDGSGFGSVTNMMTAPQEFYRILESIEPPDDGTIEFTAPDYSDGPLDGQQGWSAESGWDVADSAGDGHIITTGNAKAAVLTNAVQLAVGGTYRLSINLQFTGTYSTPTNFVYAFLGGLKDSSAGASVGTGSTAADANIQLFKDAAQYRLLSNYTTISGASTITDVPDAGDILQFDYELTLGSDAASTTYTVRLQNLTDGADTGTGSVTGVDTSIYNALTGSGAYGFFQSINPGAHTCGLSGVQVNFVVIDTNP